MAAYKFRKQPVSLRRRLALIGLPLLFLTVAAGMTWAEIEKGEQHLYRWPFAELGNYVTGVRYQVNLACAERPRARRHTLRAADFDDATGYLRSELPGCQLAEIRRIDHSLF